MESKENLIDKKVAKKSTIKLTESDTASEWSRAKFITKISLPVVLASLIYTGTDTINLLFVGSFNDKELISGIGLAYSCINLMGFTIIIGLNSTIDTLVSNAGGAGNLYLCGVYLNRARFVMTLFFIPVIAIST